MKDDSMATERWVQRVGLALLFLLFGLVIFVVFSHMRPMLPQTADLIGRIVMSAAFLAAALLARRSRRLERYWPVLFACFVASVATAIDYYLPSRDWLLQLLHVSIDTPVGLALDKLDSSVVIVASVIGLTLISGSDLSSLYLQKGQLRKSLTIGLIAFIVAAAGAIPVAQLFFGARNLQLGQVWSWLPWILIFVFANAFNEELLFRGLFLKKYGPLAGRFCANLVITIPFALHHAGVSYTPDALMFLAILLPLSLAWGFVMQKTDTLWGSVLFHAGTDIPVVLAIFSTLG